MEQTSSQALKSFSQSKLKNSFAVTVLAASLAATLLAWQHTRQSQEKTARTEFDLRTELIAADVHQRFDTYIQLLRGTVGFFAINQTLTRKQWHDYVSQLQINDRFPGMQSIGYARLIPAGERAATVANARLDGVPDYDILPPGERELYASILYREQVSGAPAQALGFDMYSDPVRRAAMDRARDSGAPTLSAKVRLLKSNTDAPQFGFLLYLPVYLRGHPPPTLAERRRDIIGFVYGALRINDFMRGALDTAAPNIGIEIFDSGTPSRQSLLYDSSQSRAYAKGDNRPSSTPSRHEATANRLARETLTKTVLTTIHGQPLTFYFAAQPSYLESQVGNQAGLVAGAGVIISLLLFAIAQALAATRERALALANTMTQEVRESEARSASIIHSSMEGIITVNQAQNIVIFNPAAERMFLCTAADAVGSPLSRFIPQRFHEAHSRHLKTFGESDTAERQPRSRHDLVGLRQNTKEFPIEASISHFSLHGEHFYTVMLRDITQRKHDEAELDRSHRELHKLTAALGTLREKEQKWLAQEIHDDLGQLLMTMKMDMATLRHGLPQDNVKLSRQLDCMQESVDAMVTSVRRIITDLRPKDLDDLGLFPALECLLLSFSKRHHIDYLFDAPKPAPPIADDIASPIYRMVQEALNNVAKHAHATQVTVQVDCRGTHIVLCIADNGTGLCDADLQKEQSYGLIGMRERARSVSGEMDIVPTPGGGVTIRVVLPSGHPISHLTAHNEHIAASGASSMGGMLDPSQIVES